MVQRGTPQKLYVAVLACLFASTVFGQGAPNPDPGGAGASPGEEALSRMESSIAQQKAAIEAFRNSAQSASWRKQRESIARQVGGLERPAGRATVLHADSGQAGDQAPTATFFTLPWPGSLALTMPNVQVADVDCAALGKGEVDRLVQSAATKHGLAPELVRAVMKRESAFKPCALSVAGAMGLMQIMPETAELLQVKDPFDPEQNVNAGAKFLKMMLERFGGDVALALGAYNAGPEAVTKAGAVPPIAETLQYVSSILGDLPFAY
jgi:soluble lytic murein transglycosylase-like protein